MKIQVASDLHLEFPENRDYLKAHPLTPTGDLLLLAGDVVPLEKIELAGDFLSYCSDHFACTYWVPGNHEYYQADAADYPGPFREAICSNLFLVNNWSVQHGSVRFLFSTLWTRIRPAFADWIYHGFNDFHQIRYGSRQLSLPGYQQLHEDCVAFLQKELEKNWTGTTFVITHHVPTLLNYPAQYAGDPFNDAFAVDMTPLMDASPIHYWLYGHHHHNGPDFRIGASCLVTNQLGYVHRREHGGFDPARVLLC
ncbi:MAG TPA: metallophosphoesterase [Chitinophagaceae bacterium]|nr:metallophosphoesterase [Chitinophagaceae bacterium]